MNVIMNVVFTLYLPIRPCEPPTPNAPPTTRPAPVAPYCHCDAHSYSPRVEQYKQLLEKEQKLCQDYEQLRRQVRIERQRKTLSNFYDVPTLMPSIGFSMRMYLCLSIAIGILQAYPNARSMAMTALAQ